MNVATSSCRACGAPRTNAEGPCVRCGVGYGEEPRCPHCQGITRIVQHPVMRWRCAACGGPRIPASKAAERGASAELSLLVKAHRANGAADFWGAAGIALTLITGIVAVLSLVLFPLSHVATIILLAGAVAAFLGRSHARGQRDKSQKETTDSIEGAWQEAAKSLLSHGGRAFRAKDLAVALGVDTPFAEALLTRLSVSDEVRTRIGEDADIEYEAPQETDDVAPMKASR